MLTLVITITGCGPKSSQSKEESLHSNHNEAFPMILEDQRGREVTIKEEPKRVVSLAPSNTEILFYLGLDEKVVGVTDYCDYPLEAQNKEKIGSFAEHNTEKILSLNPDLVLATNLHQNVVEQLEKLEVPVVVIDPENLEEVLKSIEIIGKACGKEKEAIDVVDSLEARMKKVEESIDIPVDQKPIVYYEVWPSPITTAGPGTFVNDIISKAGGVNVSGDAQKAYPQYSQEMIVAKNPEIIIFSHHGSSNQSPEDILKRPGWENVEAIKNKRVYYVDENIVQRATPRLIDGLEKFVELIHHTK